MLGKKGPTSHQSPSNDSPPHYRGFLLVSFWMFSWSVDSWLPICLGHAWLNIHLKGMLSSIKELIERLIVFSSKLHILILKVNVLEPCKFVRNHILWALFFQTVSFKHQGSLQVCHCVFVQVNQIVVL